MLNISGAQKILTRFSRVEKINFQFSRFLKFLFAYLAPGIPLFQYLKSGLSSGVNMFGVRCMVHIMVHTAHHKLTSIELRRIKYDNTGV